MSSRNVSCVSVATRASAVNTANGTMRIENRFVGRVDIEEYRRSVMETLLAFTLKKERRVQNVSS